MSAPHGDLSLKTLGPLLAGCRLGTPLHVFESVESTNTVLQQLAASGAREGTVVLAERQTAGRGRLGRAWHSPAGGGLWFSILLTPATPAAAAWGVTAAASLGVADGVRETTGLDPAVKWPNDLLLAGRKACGILTETRARGDGRLDMVIGVGLNVDLGADDFPEDVRGRATSLREASGRAVDRAALLVAILRAIDRRVAVLEREGVGAVLAAWRARSATLGRRVRVELDGRTLEGVAEDVEESGALRVRSDDGSTLTVVAGEVRVLEAPS